jgi:hypothetical protein
MHNVILGLYRTMFLAPLLRLHNERFYFRNPDHSYIQSLSAVRIWNRAKIRPFRPAVYKNYVM